MIVAIRPAPGSSTSISPISEPTPSVSRPPGPLDGNGAFGDEHQRVRGLTALHQHVTGGESHLVAPGEQLVEQLGWEAGEQLRIAHHPLVAAAVEEQRLSHSVPGVLDVAEEERMVAAPVRPHHARDEVRQRAVDERRLPNDGEHGLDPLGRPAGEEVGELGLALGEHADAEAVAFVEHPAHLARRSSEMSTSGGRSETDMNAFAVIPCTCSPTRVVSTVTPVANIPRVRLNAIAGSPSRSPTSICSESGTSSNAESPRPSSAPVAKPPRSACRIPQEAARLCSRLDCADAVGSRAAQPHPPGS